MRMVVTGPRSVGKSTTSKIISKKLGLEYISSDEMGEKIFKNKGGLDKAIKSGAIKKFIEKHGYSLVLSIFEKDNFVFDLSGGAFTSSNHDEASKEVRKKSKKTSIVVGLLPSRNFEESVNFLFKREKERKHFKEMNKKELLEKTARDLKKFRKYFKNYCNILIYVEGKNPEKIVKEILDKIKKK